MIKRCFLLPLVAFALMSCSKPDFTLVSHKNQAVIVVQENEAPYVLKAVQDMVSDIQKITGREVMVSNKTVTGSPNLVIGTLGQSVLIPDGLCHIEGKWESYALKTKGSDLYIAGSSPRGTMFGIYYFVENFVGVDPFYWWKDLEPTTRDELSFEKIDFESREPDFKFRGWFINDEDLMTEFIDGGGVRKLDYTYYHQVVHPDLAERVFEAAARLRYNLIIPASFIEIFNPAEERLLELAASRGLYLSQHHVEPMGVSAFGYFNYWERKSEIKPLFSYYSEKEKVTEVWRESAKLWGKYPNVVWQIGLRGIADRPMWLADPGVPQSDQERAAIISEAMQTQMEIISELNPGARPEVTTTLWGEGAFFNEMGLLQFPENTTIVFADNSPGWVMQKDFHQTIRQPGINYGIYYHHQLIGSGPHLAQAVPPSKNLEIFKLAKEKQSNYYAILNVGNVREFVLGIEASRDILENVESFIPSEWLNDWCIGNYGVKTGGVNDAYEAFFNSYVLYEETGTPLLLDGQSRGRAQNNLNVIRRIAATGTDLTQPITNKRQGDAFYKSLQSMHTGGSLSSGGWLAKALVQDSLLAVAAVKAEKAAGMLNGQNKVMFENNLIAHILFMQCLTGVVVETTQALIGMQKQQPDQAIAHLEAAVAKFSLYDQAIQYGSRGKWQNWYKGEKKINVRRLKEEVAKTLDLLKSKE